MFGKRLLMPSKLGTGLVRTTPSSFREPPTNCLESTLGTSAQECRANVLHGRPVGCHRSSCTLNAIELPPLARMKVCSIITICQALHLHRIDRVAIFSFISPKRQNATENTQIPQTSPFANTSNQSYEENPLL